MGADDARRDVWRVCKARLAQHMNQKISQWLALRCKEEVFQRFLRVTDEPSAIHQVRALCEVKSRREFDTDPEAAERFHQIIRKPYKNYLESHQ